MSAHGLTVPAIETAGMLARHPASSARELAALLGVCRQAIECRLAQARRGRLLRARPTGTKRTYLARVCRCGSGAAFHPVGKLGTTIERDTQVARASTVGACPLCGGVALR